MGAGEKKSWGRIPDNADISKVVPGALPLPQPPGTSGFRDLPARIERGELDPPPPPAGETGTPDQR